jgi:hypothetical protein
VPPTRRTGRCAAIERDPVVRSHDRGLPALRKHALDVRVVHPHRQTPRAARSNRGSVEGAQVQRVPGEGLIIARGPPEVVAPGRGVGRGGFDEHRAAVRDVVEVQPGDRGRVGVGSTAMTADIPYPAPRTGTPAPRSTRKSSTTSASAHQPSSPPARPGRAPRRPAEPSAPRPDAAGTRADGHAEAPVPTPPVRSPTPDQGTTPAQSAAVSAASTGPEGGLCRSHPGRVLSQPG